MQHTLRRGRMVCTFDDVPSQLTLATVPVSVDFLGMESVFLETNGRSTVDDPSGTVNVETLPPAPPPRPLACSPYIIPAAFCLRMGG